MGRIPLRVAAVVLAAGLLVGGAGCDLPRVRSPAPAGSVAASAASQPPGSAPSATRAGQAGVGDTISLTGHADGERMGVTVLQVADPAQPTADLFAPPAGHRLVGVQLRLQNIGTVDYDDAPANSATLVDAAGQRFPASYVGEITAGPAFPGSVVVATGDSALGFVVFEVPVASAVAKLQFALDSGFAEETGQWMIASGPAGSPVPPPAVTPAQPPAGADDPASVVRRYYTAINARDFATAWSLGGKNLSPSYQSFVNGFAGTRHDTLTIISVSGGTVSIELDAEQTDGSHRRYTGTYSVRAGVITSATVRGR